MSKKVFGWGGGIAILLALFCMTACQPAVKTVAAPEEEAISVDSLLEGLDALGANGSKAMLPAASIPKPDGSAFSAAELEAYLAGIKVNFAAYVASRPSNKPWLVMPVRLRAGGESGLMWVPVCIGRRLQVPVIAYHHGTQVNRASAPSRFDANPLSILSSPDIAGAFQNYVECLTGALMASAGYIVVMPDYPGFGDSLAPHPYVNLSLGNSTILMLDRAKAVLSSPLATARSNGRLYLTGYSEGGFATMAAAVRLQDSLRYVTAALPCAGSYDLAGTMLTDVLSGNEAKVPWYIPYVVYGYASVYASLDPPGSWDFGNLLNPPLPGYMPLFFGGNATGAAINAALPTKVPRLMLTDSLLHELDNKTGLVYGKLVDNTVFLTGWKPQMILQMIHCKTDDIVFAGNTEAAWQAWNSPMLPNVLPPIWVEPLPIAESLADVHLRAFPPSMLAAFMAIDLIDSHF